MKRTYQPSKKTTADYMRIPQENENQGRSQGHQPPPSHRPQAPLCVTLKQFPKTARILKRSQFQGIRRRGRRCIGHGIIIEYKTEGGAQRPKLGITVSRRFGKAHDRNRFKRVVREAFREVAAHLPSAFECNISPKEQGVQVTLLSVLIDINGLLRTMSHETS